MELQDRTALVTGSTSGIGREVAKMLAREGAEIVVSGRDADRGAETIAMIEANGGRARFVAVDFDDLDSVRRLAEEAGAVDVLVNNAGIFPFAATADQDLESFEALFDTNVRGPFFLTAAVAPRMAANGGGSIVNITTAAAEVGMSGTAAYAASKAALASLTRTWAAEFGKQGVRVNNVSAGPTRTDRVFAAFGADVVDQIAGGAPLGRAANPEEIAHVVAFLASRRSSYITGATLAADGGATAV